MFRSVQRRLFSLFNNETVDINDFVHTPNLNTRRVNSKKRPVSPKPWNSLPLRHKSGTSTPMSEIEIAEIEDIFAVLNSSLGAHLAQREKNQQQQQQHQQHQQQHLINSDQCRLPEQHHYYSRMDSSDFNSSTPKVGGLRYGGYSSCGEDDEDDDDDDEEDDEPRGVFGCSGNNDDSGRGSCRGVRRGRSSGGVGDEGEGTSSSCSDSLRSQRTMSSLNPV